MILAASECDVVKEVICAPANVNELFEFPTIFTIGGFEVTRTIILMFLAAIVAVAILYFGLRRQQLVPTKFGAAVEGMVGFVRDGIARDVIGPEGVKYLPYLMAMFFFLLVGNLFEVTPLINFPITSRMAIPAFLALVIGASVAMFFATVMLVRALFLTEDRVVATEPWQVMEPEQRPVGDAGRAVACDRFETMLLGAAKNAAGIASVMFGLGLLISWA